MRSFSWLLSLVAAFAFANTAYSEWRNHNSHDPLRPLECEYRALVLNQGHGFQQYKIFNLGRFQTIDSGPASQITTLFFKVGKNDRAALVDLLPEGERQGFLDMLGYEHMEFSCELNLSGTASARRRRYERPVFETFVSCSAADAGAIYRASMPLIQQNC